MAIKKKITRDIKRQKTQFEGTEQASKSDMAGMLEFYSQKFKTVNILKDLPLGSTQEQMNNVGRGIEILVRIKNKC